MVFGCLDGQFTIAHRPSPIAHRPSPGVLEPKPFLTINIENP